MYLRYAGPSGMTEEELKHAIVRTIADIVENWPEHFEVDPSAIPAASDETSLFLSRLVGLPPLQTVRGKIQEPSYRSLVIAFRFVTLLYWCCEIEIRLVALISVMFTAQFLGMRYIVAAELIENVLHEELKSNFDMVSEALMNPYNDPTPEIAEYCDWAAIAEIERVLGNPATQSTFTDTINRFEDSVEAHIKKAIPMIIREVTFRMMMESVTASAWIIDSTLETDDPVDMKFFGEIMDTIVRTGRKWTNERLGIRRGGRRQSTKFVWNDQRKRQFFEKVSSLVHTSGEPLWRYAYEELKGKNFDYRIINWLRSETALRDVPKELWNKAIKAWQGGESSLIRLAADKTPESFAMYHAMYLLDYPETAFSTMKRYFGQGKKLSNVNPNV